jgi:hypothetical protein
MGGAGKQREREEMKEGAGWVSHGVLLGRGAVDWDDAWAKGLARIPGGCGKA